MSLLAHLGRKRFATSEEIDRYIRDIGFLQEQRKEAANQDEAQRFNRLVECAQLVLERLLEKVEGK